MTIVVRKAAKEECRGRLTIDVNGSDNYSTGASGSVPTHPTYDPNADPKQPSSKSFVECLMYILDHEDSQVIAWTKDGNSFQIRDRVRLEREILPKYFKHSRYHSFTRQLNYHGFLVVRPGSKPVTYASENFTRGNRDRVKLIKKRVTRKMSGDKKPEKTKELTPTAGKRTRFKPDMQPVAKREAFKGIPFPKNGNNALRFDHPHDAPKPLPRLNKAVFNAGMTSSSGMAYQPARAPFSAYPGMYRTNSGFAPLHVKPATPAVSGDEAMTALILGTLASTIEAKETFRYKHFQHPLCQMNGYGEVKAGSH